MAARYVLKISGKHMHTCVRNTETHTHTHFIQKELWYLIKSYSAYKTLYWFLKMKKKATKDWKSLRKRLKFSPIIFAHTRETKCSLALKGPNDIWGKSGWTPVSELIFRIRGIFLSSCWPHGWKPTVNPIPQRVLAPQNSHFKCSCTDFLAPLFSKWDKTLKLSRLLEDPKNEWTTFPSFKWLNGIEVTIKICQRIQ